MSDLRNLIKESKAIKKELVASTVRMPKELYSFIEGLADQLTRSKQEVILELIKEGVRIAEEELRLKEGVRIAEEELRLKENKEEKNSTFHILNTNRRNDVNDHGYMLKNGIAAAFFDPWKFDIDRISKGDTVFLYENGVGIIAYGKGTGKTLKKDRYGNKDECHYQELLDFNILKKPMPAAEIKKTLGRNIVFLKTMSEMPDGQKVLDKINNK